MKILPVAKRTSEIPVDPPTASNVVVLDSIAVGASCDSFWVTDDLIAYFIVDKTIESYDCSDPNNLILLQSYTNTGYDSSSKSICVVGNYAYSIGRSGNTLSITNVTDSSNMVYVGSVITLGDGNLITTDGKFLYTARSTRDTFISNIDDPEIPVFESSIVNDVDTTPTYITTSTQTTGDLISVLSSRDGFQLTNMSDSLNPSLTSLYKDSDNLPDVFGCHYAYEESIVYGGATENRDSPLSAINYANKSIPVFLSSFIDRNNLEGLGKIEGTIGGPLLFIENRDNSTIAIIDKSDPLNMFAHSYPAIDISGGNRMFIKGHTLYVGGNTLIAIDIT